MHICTLRQAQSIWNIIIMQSTCKLQIIHLKPVLQYVVITHKKNKQDLVFEIPVYIKDTMGMCKKHSTSSKLTQYLQNYIKL